MVHKSDKNPEKLTVKFGKETSKNLIRLCKKLEKERGEEISYSRVVRYLLRQTNNWKEDKDDI